VAHLRNCLACANRSASDLGAWWPHLVTASGSLGFLLRTTSIVLPILYIVSIAISSIGETWAYYYFMSAAESAFLALIVWHAWTWPSREGT
jgi:hypothetical protein